MLNFTIENLLISNIWLIKSLLLSVSSREAGIIFPRKYRAKVDKGTSRDIGKAIHPVPYGYSNDDYPFFMSP